MWRDKKISLAFPTYREKDSMFDAIMSAVSTDIIDEVLVVNNNAEAGTSEEVARAQRAAEGLKHFCTIREVSEPVQGYGAACLRGLDEARGDYVVLSEPDGTFTANDVYKLVAYADDYGIVFGSRTVKEFIWGGANMWWFLRWGNWFVAKMLEVLFNTNSLTDVGCTMRLIKREELSRMRGYLTIHGSFFGPQMLLVAALLKLKFVQIPVNYRSRVGVSSVTGSFWKAFQLGCQMIVLILEYRFGKLRHGTEFLTKRNKVGLFR
jgi:glycosyltransferase involved in cell wall biosynthesis